MEKGLRGFGRAVWILLGCLLAMEARAAEEVNLALSEGFRLIVAPSQHDDGLWAAGNVFDGRMDPGHQWASQTDPAYPQDFVLQLPPGRNWMVTRLEVLSGTADAPDRWAREVSLWLAYSPEGPWLPAGRFFLEQKKGDFQNFTFTPVRGRFALLRVESNWGGRFAELAEVRIFGYEEAREPFFPQATSKPTPVTPPPLMPPSTTPKRELENLTGGGQKFAPREQESGMSVRGDERPPDMQKKDAK